MDKKLEGLPRDVAKAFGMAVDILLHIYHHAEPIEYDKRDNGITSIVYDDKNKKWFSIRVKELTDEEVEAETSKITYVDAFDGHEAKDAIYQHKQNRGI